MLYWGIRKLPLSVESRGYNNMKVTENLAISRVEKKGPQKLLHRHSGTISKMRFVELSHISCINHFVLESLSLYYHI